MLSTVLKKSLDRFGFEIHRKRPASEQPTESEIAVSQLQDALAQAGAFPLPPPHLQPHVSGVYEPRFVQMGDEALDDYEKILEPAGRTLSSFRRVLDFGCNVGRILRAFYYRRTEDQELYGTDIDVPAIEWCQQNYPFADFSINEPEPPLKYDNEFFDFVYANSVMTHLTEDSQFRWLAELRRIVNPGGLLILTFAGEHCLNYWPLSDEQRAQGRAGFLWTPHCSYHTHDYVRERWSKYFEIVELRERAVHAFQDSALLRRR